MAPDGHEFYQQQRAVSGCRLGGMALARVI